MLATAWILVGGSWKELWQERWQQVEAGSSRQQQAHVHGHMLLCQLMMQPVPGAAAQLPECCSCRMLCMSAPI